MRQPIGDLKVMLDDYLGQQSSHNLATDCRTNKKKNKNHKIAYKVFSPVSSELDKYKPCIFDF